MIVVATGSGGGASAGVSSYKNAFGHIEHEGELAQLIHRQDEEVLTVIVMAVISGKIL